MQTLLARRLDGIAAELAGRLEDGEPCAVCGATEHPAPAAAPAGGIGRGGRGARGRGRRRGAGRRPASGPRTRSRPSTLRSPPPAPSPARRRPSSCGSRADAASAGLDAARLDAARTDAVAAELADLRAGRERDGAEHGEAQRAAASAAAEAREGTNALAKERAAIEAGRAGAPTIAERVRALTAAADAAEAAASALDAAAAAGAEADEARARAAEAAAEAGFADLDSLRAALRDAAGCDDIEQRLRRYDDGLAERRSAARPPGAGRSRCRSRAGRARARARGRRGRGRRGRRPARARARPAPPHRSRDPARPPRRCARGGRPGARAPCARRELSELASGTAATTGCGCGCPRTCSPRASRRWPPRRACGWPDVRRPLRARAHRRQRRAGDRRGGLGLRVRRRVDRPPAPAGALSGGETFLASLALALGLADVVTAEAGGARLETLFVDEGFGTLDDEGTLDEVLDVLDALRDGRPRDRHRLPRRRAAPADPRPAARREGPLRFAGAAGGRARRGLALVPETLFTVADVQARWVGRRLPWGGWRSQG